MPIDISISRTKTGEVYRLTIPKKIREDDHFPIDVRKQLYARIVRAGLLITNDLDREE